MDHTVVHFEIPAKDVEKLRSFYTKLFGWKIEKSPMPMDYWTIQTVPVNEKMMPIRLEINGGLYKKERPELTSVNYITVESLDKTVKKIKGLGCKIIQPKQEVPTVGAFVIAPDPEGNPIGILQPEMP